MKKPIDAINAFIDGYTKKDVNKLDDFMNLISSDESVEMIGIGATKPGKYEWFKGKDEIKEIVKSDWTFWGNVIFEIEHLTLTEKENNAWFSIPATLETVEMKEETWEFFLSQMKDLLDKKQQLAHDRIFEATHYGMRRIREKNLGVGHKFDMIVTGVLVKEEMWRFHSLHWSMPVD